MGVGARGCDISGVGEGDITAVSVGTPRAAKTQVAGLCISEGRPATATTHALNQHCRGPITHGDDLIAGVDDRDVFCSGVQCLLAGEIKPITADHRVCVVIVDLGIGINATTTTDGLGKKCDRSIAFSE